MMTFMWNQRLFMVFYNTLLREYYLCTMLIPFFCYFFLENVEWNYISPGRYQIYVHGCTEIYGGIEGEFVLFCFLERGAWVSHVLYCKWLSLLISRKKLFYKTNIQIKMFYFQDSISMKSLVFIIWTKKRIKEVKCCALV